MFKTGWLAFLTQVDQTEKKIKDCLDENGPDRDIELRVEVRKAGQSVS